MTVAIHPICGVIELLFAPGDVPTGFVAVTVNVYETPSLRPVIFIGLLVPVNILEVPSTFTVYESMGEVRALSGSSKFTIAYLSPTIARILRGASGSPAGFPPGGFVLIS